MLLVFDGRLAAAEALAVRWWLEGRQLVNVGHLVKTV